jgi:hypothetical protein
MPKIPSMLMDKVRAKYCSQFDNDKFQTYEIRNDIVNNGMDNFKKIADFINLAK